MKPDKLKGMHFTIPLFCAETQEYIVKDSMEVLPTNWELRLEKMQSNYSVPENIKIVINKLDNNRLNFILYEINKSGDCHHFFEKTVNIKECNSLVGLKNVIQKLVKN